jgi:hypothetical protein
MARIRRTAFAMAVSFLVAALAGGAWAKSGKSAATKPAPASKAVNPCGCYSDAQGHCFCKKAGKCECPGECEPKGCEERRARQMQKEVASETKKAAERDRKARQEEGKQKPDPNDVVKPKPRPVDKDGVGQ